jgi:glycosyltransferase involved in cell wall biosynthesis
MHIGVNLLYLLPGLVGGTEVYAAGLLAGLAQIDSDNEYIVFVNRESAAWTLPSASNFSRVVCPVWATSRVRLPRMLKQQRLDLVHSLGYVSPLFSPCASIVTIPDLNYRAFGDRMPAAKRLALEFFVKQSVRHASHVITISEFARGQILSVFGVPPSNITTTLLASSSAEGDLVDLAITLRRYGIDKPYIIAFSSSSPNKNIPRLVHAFTQARRDYGLPHLLVLVGHKPHDELTNELGAVVLTGYVDESSKQALIVGAEMLVFPSTYEGFGLPVLDAQRAGVPVACSTAASLPEVAGEGAVFFDPFSVSEIAKAIGQVAQDTALRESLRKKGLRNVSRFSWDKTAKSTLDVYHEVHSQYSAMRRNHR